MSVEPPTWEFWRSTIEAADRPEPWRRAGLWALDRLSERLSGDWPARTWDKYGRLPAGLAYSVAHAVAFAEVLELALRLELLRGCGGIADVTRALRRDPREEAVQHLRLQLEIGGLAVRAGHAVSFEPPLEGSTRVADVEIRLADGSHSIIVEARAIFPDQNFMKNQHWTDGLFAQIRAIGARHGVGFEGEIAETLDEHRTSELLDTLEAHARLVGLGAHVPEVRVNGARLRIHPEAAAMGKRLTGPAAENDLWPRTLGKLVEKAKQTSGADRVWLRIDAYNGLWQFTPWSLRNLTDKLALMAESVREGLAEYAHLSGLVMSNGAGLAQGRFCGEVREGEDGAVGVRRLLTPLRVRETLIIPLGSEATEPRTTHSGRTIWRELYGEEPGWLDWALEQLALPPVSAIFPASDQRGIEPRQ